MRYMDTNGTPEQSRATFEDAASGRGVPPGQGSCRFHYCSGSAVLKHCVFL